MTLAEHLGNSDRYSIRFKVVMESRWTINKGPEFGEGRFQYDKKSGKGGLAAATCRKVYIRPVGVIQKGKSDISGQHVPVKVRDRTGKYRGPGYQRI